MYSVYTQSLGVSSVNPSCRLRLTPLPCQHRGVERVEQSQEHIEVPLIPMPFEESTAINQNLLVGDHGVMRIASAQFFGDLIEGGEGEMFFGWGHGFIFSVSS